MITATINGKRTPLEGHPMARLLDVLRASGLTGVKEGCGEASAARAPCCSTARS
jgi:aerobic-type carbon monoxide dehydrogenase small subunit (CoxS/CutS family)